MSELDESRQQKIPVSVGKPSLRLRLEAFYRRVSPQQLENGWQRKFEKIWSKYGGSPEGEAQLSSKLTEKYGDSVRFQTASKSQIVLHPVLSHHFKDELWYALRDGETKSNIIDFTQDGFDPVAALRQPYCDVVAQNEFVAQCPLVDRVAQLRCTLPKEDPNWMQPSGDRPQTGQSIAVAKPQLSSFLSIAKGNKDGTFSLLYDALSKRLRIRVVVRDASSICGAMTGLLLAYDKHLNLLLGDAVKVNSHHHSNLAGTSGPTVKKRERKSGGEAKKRGEPRRHMRELFVRGDSVVLVHKL